MEEKILKGNKNGMLVLILSLVVYIAAVFGAIWSGINGVWALRTKLHL